MNSIFMRMILITNRITRERVFRAVEWCHKNGYRPATISSIAFEPRKQEE